MCHERRDHVRCKHCQEIKQRDLDPRGYIAWVCLNPKCESNKQSNPETLAAAA
jgi:hypothetical protein